MESSRPTNRWKPLSSLTIRENTKLLRRLTTIKTRKLIKLQGKRKRKIQSKYTNWIIIPSWLKGSFKWTILSNSLKWMRTCTKTRHFNFLSFTKQTSNKISYLENHSLYLKAKAAKSVLKLFWLAKTKNSNKTSSSSLAKTSSTGKLNEQETTIRKNSKPFQVQDLWHQANSQKLTKIGFTLSDIDPFAVLSSPKNGPTALSNDEWYILKDILIKTYKILL